MHSLTYISPEGERYMLTDSSQGVFVEYDTLTGLVGEYDDPGLTVPGMPGALFVHADRQVRAMTGSFVVVVRDPAAWVGFRRGLYTHEEGRLELHFDDDDAPWVLPVRLSKPLPAPGHKVSAGDRITVDLVADGGVWQRTMRATGTATVTNGGNVPVWPRVVWSGAGGRVTLPSGAVFTLPAVTGEHTVYLDRLRAGHVYTRTGLSAALTRQVGAVPESTPVGDSSRYSVPAGARLEWEIGVFDPWSN